MTESYVQAPANGAGKKIDATELANIDGTTVERFRIAIPDGMMVYGDIIDAILREIKLTNDLLAQASGLGSDVETMRNIGTK